MEDFQKAYSILDRLKNHGSEIDFFISFGQVIAYDNLGLRDQCQSALASLFLILNEDDENNNIGSEVSEDRLPQEYDESANTLKTLASLAPSLNIRELLLSLIDEMSEQVLPLFKIAYANYSHADWKYYDNENRVSVKLCKTHFWKKFNKIAKKVFEFVAKVEEVWNIINKIEEQLKN